MIGGASDSLEPRRSGRAAAERGRDVFSEEYAMTGKKDTARAQHALLAALARNRGELDAATLERLLRLVAALEPAR